MKDAERMRLVNVIRALANGLVFTNAMAFRFLFRERWSFDAEVIFWILFVAVLLVVNVWVYFSFEKNSKASRTNSKTMPTDLPDRI